jgi:hypothetical protein
MNFVQKTQKKVEKSKKKLAKTIELKSYKKLAVNFLILSINLIIIIVYFSLSEAKVVISPTKEIVNQSLSLPILSDGEEIEGSEITIPGQIENIDVSTSKTFEIEFETESDAIARGTFIIYNTTPSRAQTFVKNTRFHDINGVEFKITKQVTIGAGNNITVEAFASESGASGNVSEGRFQVSALPYLEDKIYAEIEQPFTGGIITSKSVTIDEYNKAKEEIEEKLKDVAWETFSASSSSVERENMVINITDLSSTANPGDTDVEQFTISAQGTANIFSYDNGRAKEIIKQQLIKNIPANMVLSEFNEDSYTAVLNSNERTVNLSITAWSQPKISEFALNKEDIIGMNKQEVQDYFTKITGITDVQIKFSPFWVRSVPNLKDHIDIEIKK